MLKLEEGLAQRALETHRDRQESGQQSPLEKMAFKTCHLQEACKLQGRSLPKRHPTSRAFLATSTRVAKSCRENPGGYTALLTA